MNAPSVLFILIIFEPPARAPAPNPQPAQPGNEPRAAGTLEQTTSTGTRRRTGTVRDPGSGAAH